MKSANLRRFSAFLLIALALTSLMSLATGQDISPEKIGRKVISFFTNDWKDAIESFGGEEFRRVRMVEEGVRHIQEWDKEGPLFYNALSVNIEKKHIRLEAEKGGETLFTGEQVATIAERETFEKHNVVAAVNGDFWMAGFRPVGLFVDDGTILKPPHPERSVFFLDEDGNPYIDVLNMKIFINVNGKEFPVNDINRVGIDDAILFTPRYGKPIEFEEPRQVFVLEQVDDEFLPNRECTVKLLTYLPSETKIPELSRGFYLAVKPSAPEDFEGAIKDDPKFEIIAKLINFDKTVTMAVGGVPRILRNGEVSVEYEKEDIGESFSTTRHPRTAVGLSKDKKTVYFLTVDGRQPGLSIGVDLPDLAEYMKNLGAWDAMNLDGGGSTTMWVRGEVVNYPSDAGGPRTVSNAILVVSKSRIGKPAHLEIEPDYLRMPPAVSFFMDPAVYDENYNRLDYHPEKIQWSVEGNIGTVSDTGMVTLAEKPGSGKVIASIDEEIQDETRIDIIKPVRLSVKPEVIMMSEAEEQKLKILAEGPDVQRLMIKPSMVDISSTGDLRWNPVDSKIKAASKGKYKLKVELAGLEQEIPVYVDYFRSDLIFSFDNKEKVNLTMTRSDEDKTRLLEETEIKKEGKASLRVDYTMLHGGTSAIYLNIDRPVADRPYALGVWIYGDGKEQWIRGIFTDRDGEEFLADFTGGTKGVYWNDEWRYVDVQTDELNAKWSNPDAIIDYPLTLKQLYIVQTREEKKSRGSLLFDAFTAEYPQD